MAAGRKQQYLFYTNTIDHCTNTITGDEFDESDVWGYTDLDGDRSANDKNTSRSFPTTDQTTKSKIKSKKKDIHRFVASSLPMNVPDWSKNRRGESEMEEEDEYEMGSGGRVIIIPPHEYLWQQRRRSGVSSFSVHEGVGRTLKGRDLSRVRNAVWEKIGFQD